MKKHALILLSTVLFTVIFYGEETGLNFGILGISYAVLSLIHTRKINKTSAFYILFILTILSSMAFAYYADFSSFVSVILSALLLTFKARNRNIKPLLLFPVFILNGFTFICRFFNFDQWLPKSHTSQLMQRILAYVLFPLIALMAFFGIYSLGSENFSEVFKNYELSIDAWQLIVMTFLGFFLAFNYWNFSIERFIYKRNSWLENDFSNSERTVKPTFSFLGLQMERTGGVITFIVLNILLLVFIITYNYEQFYQASKLPHQLSEDIHERVYAVILSVGMAIFLILFYFKSSFNFDKEAGLLKLSAYGWLALNAVLVISAFAKNTEYIYELGLTYKRIGVYAFLILCLIGLFFSYLKIKNRRTNAFLFNRMFWYFYGTILAAAVINWGNIATLYNIENGKGDFNFLKLLNYNDEVLIEKFPEEIRKTNKKKYIKSQQNKTFLSKVIYWQTINTDTIK